MRKNVGLLTLCQALFFMANTILISTSALVGLQLAPAPTMATLPLGFQFLAAMAMAMPASLLQRRFGRGRGLAIGTVFGLASGIVGAIALIGGNFLLFMFASVLYGLFSAFCQFYRFAAADAADRATGGDKKARARAISWVLAGGLVAAIAGPELAKLSKDWIDQALFAGCFVAISGLAVLSFLALSALDLPAVKEEAAAGKGRPLSVIFQQPDALVALLAAIVAYITMNLLMTATPLAMRHSGHIFESTAFVIQWHVVGMFAPSFFTGSIIGRFGEKRVIVAGIVFLTLSVFINMHGDSLVHFVAALALLGIGWNFAFIGGTSLLTRCYEPAEKAKVQGFNDLALFSCVAVSASSAGALHELLGWQSMNLAAIPALALVLILVLRPSAKPVLAR